MILEMYAMKDELNGFTTPIPFISEEVAKRYLKDQVMGNPTVKNSTEDFSMWKIGTYDTETGIYNNETKGPGPILVERAKNYV